METHDNVQSTQSVASKFMSKLKDRVGRMKTALEEQLGEVDEASESSFESEEFLEPEPSKA
jgi:hypothetical protein